MGKNQTGDISLGFIKALADQICSYSIHVSFGSIEGDKTVCTVFTDKLDWCIQNILSQV